MWITQPGTSIEAQEIASVQAKGKKRKERTEKKRKRYRRIVYLHAMKLKVRANNIVDKSVNNLERGKKERKETATIVYTQRTVVQNSHEYGRRYWATRSSVCSLARSVAPLTHLLAPHCSLLSHAPLRSFIGLLGHSLGSWESK